MPRTIGSGLAAGALASGCIVVPVTTDTYDPDCRRVTHHMALEPVQIARLQTCSGQGCEAMVLAGLGLTAISAVVSGSIVVVGNVVYWADHRAACPPRSEAPPSSAV